MKGIVLAVLAIASVTPLAGQPVQFAEVAEACVPLDDDVINAPPEDSVMYMPEALRALQAAREAIEVGRATDDPDRKKCFFRIGEALARRLVFADPNDPEPRYLYAAAMALRADAEGGRTQVRLAIRTHEQLLAVLSVAPAHAGAQHILGRLHAGVMRINGFERFIATRLLGGSTLKGASWESAESLLTAAERLDPSVPAHHYELGALYADTGRPELALLEFEHVLARPFREPHDREIRERTRTLAASLRGGGSQAVSTPTEAPGGANP